MAAKQIQCLNQSSTVSPELTIAKRTAVKYRGSGFGDQGQVDMAAGKRKYFASLIPFIICGGLSVIFSLKEPLDFPDASYPYRTKEYLDFLSQGWLLVGVVLSGVFLSIILIDDIFSYFERLREERRAKK